MLYLVADQWDNTQIHLTYHPAGTGKAVTHGAALSLGCDDLLAVRQQFTLDLVADGDTVVADADTTRLWFPDVVVMVDLPIDCAAFLFLLICSCGTGQKQVGYFTGDTH